MACAAGASAVSDHPLRPPGGDARHSTAAPCRIRLLSRLLREDPHLHRGLLSQLFPDSGPHPRPPQRAPAHTVLHSAQSAHHSGRACGVVLRVEVLRSSRSASPASVVGVGRHAQVHVPRLPRRCDAYPHHRSGRGAETVGEVEGHRGAQPAPRRRTARHRAGRPQEPAEPPLPLQHAQHHLRAGRHQSRRRQEGRAQTVGPAQVHALRGCAQREPEA